MQNTNKQSKTKIAITTVIAICIAVVIFFLGFGTFYLILSPAQREAMWFIGKVDKHYLCYDEDTGEIKSFTAEDYLEKLSELVDKYSNYYTKEEYTEVISTSKGNRYGIGLYFSLNGSTKIVGVAGNSPAKKAQVKTGSVIKSVTYNGTVTTVANFDEFSQTLNAIPSSTDFTITVDCDGVLEDYTLSKRIYIESYAEYFDNAERYAFESDYGLSPTDIKEPSNKMNNLADDTAYISLSGFESVSAEQFGKAITYATQKGKTKLILDLRGNGGGYMDVLRKTAEYLVKSQVNRTLVAVAKYKNGTITEFYTSVCRYQQLETVVLADDGSASATECLIGAMLTHGTLDKDHFVAVKSNGESLAHTYGKGIMQTTYPNILSGSAVKLTTAYVFWPDKTTNIHGKGIFATAENSVAPNSFGQDYAVNRAIEILAN